MNHVFYLVLALLIVGFFVADTVLGWGATIFLAKWLFGAIDTIAFWRYL